MARDSFEIYYFQNGRWSVHASFEANEREIALAEAQKVDKTLGLPVRLVRETFDKEANTSQEAIAWQSAKAKQMGDADNMFGGGAGAPKAALKKKPTPPKSAPAAAPRREPKQDATPAPKKAGAKPPPKKSKKKQSGRGLWEKVAVVVGYSFVVSMAVAGAVWASVWGMSQITKSSLFGSENQTLVLGGTFLLTYVIALFYNAGKQFEIAFFWRRKAKAKKQEDRGPGAGDMLRRMREASVEADVANAEVGPQASLVEMDIEQLREQVAQEDAEESGDRTGDDDFATTVQDEAPSEPAPQPEAQPEAPPPPQPEAPKPQAPEPKPEEKRAEKPPEKAPEKTPDKPAEGPAESEARQGLAAFTREALAAAMQGQPQLNAFSRFGLNLYVAGACAAIGQAKKLGRTVQLAVLRDSLQAAGNTRERAESFCAELPSHGKNPRYSAMVQAGSSAMSQQLAGQPGGTQELTALLAEWSKPEKRPSVPSAFTFMFTDIVNSTALTSQLGNAGAQRVVRAHNTAVRGAIQAFQGREVKHTGDGIMATFPTPIAAVQAAIRAQKEIAAHSGANPSVAFTVRIGVNVGEAVEEDNDFFGAAVQMTARICSVCTPTNAWVSRAVVDACKGQRVGFIPRGAFQMKGIQQARPLYEVAYTDSHKNEVANL